MDSEYQFHWMIYGLTLSNLTSIPFASLQSTGVLYGPFFTRANFTITGNPTDTFVLLSGWTKGIVVVNGHNIGRYWKIGPQQTLYLPAPYLQTGTNTIVVFELEQTIKPVIQLIDYPILSQLDL